MLAMRSFRDLVEEAAAVYVSGWDFGWLDGRATEERPAWGYSRLLAKRLGHARSALDIDTGGGEIIADVPRLPSRMTVTEGWAPNVAHARDLLSRRGVEGGTVEPESPLPFRDASLKLAT